MNQRRSRNGVSGVSLRVHTFDDIDFISADMDRTHWGDVHQATGITGIDMITPGFQVRHPMPPLTEPLSSLVDDIVASTVTYANWVRLPIWLKDIDIFHQ
jgi:hypothetical protein